MTQVHGTRVTTGYLTKNALPSISRTRTVEAAATLLLKLDEPDGNTAPVDSSVNAFTITGNANVALSNAQAKFGTTSLDTGAADSGKYLSMSYNSIHNLAEELWTAECWVYLTAMPAVGVQGETITWNNNTGATNDGYAQIRMAINNNGSMFFLVAGSTASAWKNNTQTATSLITINNWIHLAGVRDSSNVFRLYINGTQRLNYTSSVTTFNHAGPTYIGALSALGVVRKRFAGYIDCVRVIKGHCLYPNGTTFTPSTTELTATASYSATINNAIYGLRAQY